MKAEENEQLLQIISDALRDGPGSSAWGEAVRLVDAGDGAELETLYRARERLESGKKWRQVRPGIGFTRKLMDAVDQQSDASVRATGPATIIAIVCGLLIVVVIAALVPMLLSHGKAPEPVKDEFQNIFFATPWVQSDFENSISGDWKTTGNVKVTASHGLHASGLGDWGIISTQSLGTDQFFNFDAKIEIPSDGTAAKMFVSDGKNQLTAVVDAQHVQVILPAGEIAFNGSRPLNVPMELRWLIGPASAALEINGQRVWAGTNNLTSGQARFVGVQFVLPSYQAGTAKIDSIEVRTKS